MLGDRVVGQVRKGVCDAFFVVGAEREARVAVRVVSRSLVRTCQHQSLVTTTGADKSFELFGFVYIYIYIGPRTQV